MRWCLLLNIYFESDKEVIHFCESLFRYNKQIELKWKTNEDWGNHIYFNEDIVNQETVQAIGKAMVDVFILFRLTNEIRKLIMEKYYYTNDDEIDEILDHTHWILKEGHPQLKNSTRPTQLVLSLFIENITDVSAVHFDSIVKFRLNLFKDQLLNYIGLAIDEFKQEEEHQSFVEMLRTYILKKKPTYNEIHVVQGNNFSFFRSNGKRFSSLELRNLMHREPLYIVGLDINEMNLAPLVAIAPQRIHIYGDRIGVR
jgi:putative sporulation protein YtxC